MSTSHEVQFAVPDDDGLTLEQLCSVCAVTPSWVSLRIEEGLIGKPEGEPTLWRFDLSTRLRVGRMHVLEFPIHADGALIKAERGDRRGNLVYRNTARDFGPIMASAATLTVALTWRSARRRPVQ